MKIAYIEDSNIDFILFQNVFAKKDDFETTRYKYLDDFLCADDPYDIIVADLSLPDAYGPEVLLRIRKITGKPIFVLSNLGGDNPNARITKAIKDTGATYFSSKDAESLKELPNIILNLI